MGADMLLYMLPAVEPTEERQQAIKDLLEVMDMTQQDGLSELYDSGTLDNVIDCGDEDFDENGLLAEHCQDDLRQYILERMDEYWGWYEGTGRDTVHIDSDGRCYYLTGGISWGDLPTDSAGLIDFFNYLPEIWQTLQTWALEDAVKSRRDLVQSLADELTTALSRG